MKGIEFKKVYKALEGKKNIVIISHKNPDGDSIGASLGLGLFLESRKFKVTQIVPNKYPEFLEWLPGIKKIIIAKENKDLIKAKIKKAEVIICVDFNSISRIDTIKKEYKESKALKILIDHHPSPDLPCDILISDTNSSSTSELVYNVIETFKVKSGVTKAIAECIYTGIMTDTGSFSFSCNNPKTYIITSKLIKAGVEAQIVHNMIYDNYSENRMRLLGNSLLQSMVVLPEYETAYIALTSEELNKYNYEIGDTEGFVNYPISIKGINFSILFLELDEQIKISFRSKGDIAVNDIAKKYFNGGGHKNAAGGQMKSTLKEAIEKLVSILPEYMKNNV